MARRFRRITRREEEEEPSFAGSVLGGLAVGGGLGALGLGGYHGYKSYSDYPKLRAGMDQEIGNIEGKVREAGREAGAPPPQIEALAKRLRAGIEKHVPSRTSYAAGGFGSGAIAGGLSGAVAGSALGALRYLLS